MKPRTQRTIATTAQVTGVGFLTGADITLRFIPAEAGHGVAFTRTDKQFAPPIPAVVSYTVPRSRRTAISRCGVVVEMVEHVLAALAGLQIDNCLVELDGPEPPGCDGSSLQFAEALLQAGIVDQGAPRERLELRRDVVVYGDEADQSVYGTPAADGHLHIRYSLDYGADSPIQPQHYEVTVTPQNFIDQIMFARTFVLEHEAHALRAQGYGKRTTARDLLIFGAQGVIDNSLRCPDECARHKILDCIGDFALAGCDLSGYVDAHRTGHQLNAEFVRRVKLTHAEAVWPTTARKAA
ncbi:MAG: UDP-3-O-acyl-N-acetylglucosamine deacetylase [Planctomycetes bacterium]|nr:UDP-3-O-acyl-N-acetylglucosamine deacetylase [Planctomycetota bacterium]